MRANRPRALALVRVSAYVALFALAGSCGGSGGGTGDGVPGGSRPTAKDKASVSPDPVKAAKGSSPGSFAADYLHGTNFVYLTVEIDYPAGKAPSSAAVALFESRLTERCAKIDVSVVVDDAIPASEFPPYLTTQQLMAREDAHRDTYSNLATHTVAMYVIYVPGEFSGDNAVLGLSYRGGSFALFIDNAIEAGGLMLADDYEAYALVHEAGHLMGMVHGGTPMVTPHEDPSSDYHDVHPSCVMYWVISIPLGGLGSPEFAKFDDDCVADIQAFGGW